jgi:hypothetical protein
MYANENEPSSIATQVPTTRLQRSRVANTPNASGLRLALTLTVALLLTSLMGLARASPAAAIR